MRIPTCLAALCAGSFLLLACAPTLEMSPMQFRQISTRLIDGSYENVFKATMSVLQDNLYVIKQTDMDSGLISAEVNRETSGFAQFLEKLFSKEINAKGTLVEASAVVSRISDKVTEVRITVQETAYGETGETTTVKPLQDAGVYKALFDQIVLEVKRREAIGR